MRTMRMACTLAGVVLSGVVSGVALAQAPMGPPPVPGPAGEVERSYAAQKDNLLKTPADTADKATIVAGLKGSFAECDKAYGSTTDANFTELLSVGPAKRTRAGGAVGKCVARQ
jgi:hypothetical protein